MLDQFQRTFELQEAAKAENEDKTLHLLERVRDLELNSWDRTDAQEDLGSAP
jgi:hypothetical protein